MSLPTNRIKKVKLPNNTEYEIIPEKISDGSDNYATLPDLSNDNGKIAVNNIDNNFTAVQTFGDNIRTSRDEISILAQNPSQSGDYEIAHFIVNFDNLDNFIGTSVTASGHFTAYGDTDDADTNKPDSQLTDAGDIDTDYFNTGVTLRDVDNEETYKLSFPAKNGVFATTDDCQIPIDDLTQINS